MDNPEITITIEAYVTALKRSFELGHQFVEVRVGQSTGWDLLEPIIRKGVESFITLSNTQSPPAITAPPIPGRQRPDYYASSIDFSRKWQLGEIREALKHLSPGEYQNAHALREVCGLSEEMFAKYPQARLRRMIHELETIIIYRQCNGLQ